MRISRTDIQAMQCHSLGCYWPSKGNYLREPAWFHIYLCLDRALAEERDRREFCGGPSDVSDELQRLRALAAQKCGVFSD